MTNNSAIEAVIGVCRAESARLRELVRDLEANSDPRILESILKSISKTGDILSSALARVSSYVDQIEEESESETRQAQPEPDDALLQISARLKAAIRFGLCDQCGGVKGHAERIEPDAEPVAPEHVREAAWQSLDEEF